MVSVRLPQELEVRIEHLCAMSKRSKSFIIKEALEMHLDDLEGAYIALERMKDPNPKYYTTDELIKELKLKKSDFDDI